jgi:hypothetical protein
VLDHLNKKQKRKTLFIVTPLIVILAISGFVVYYLTSSNSQLPVTPAKYKINLYQIWQAGEINVLKIEIYEFNSTFGLSNTVNIASHARLLETLNTSYDENYLKSKLDYSQYDGIYIKRYWENGGVDLSTYWLQNLYPSFDSNGNIVDFLTVDSAEFYRINHIVG